MKIITYPDPLLNEKSIDVTEDYLPDVLKTIPEMTQLMRSRVGAAIAAVQVGILRRYCLLEEVNLVPGDPRPEPHLLINPEITEFEGELVNEFEGCLSLPAFWNPIERSSTITVKFTDKNWIKRTAVFEGLQARAIQHEIEHMDGILQLSKLSPMKLDMWKKKLAKRGIK